MKAVKRDMRRIHILGTAKLLLLCVVLLVSAPAVSAWDAGKEQGEENRNFNWHDVLGVKELHALSTGEGVVVAVIDTGIDLANPLLIERLWLNAGEIAGDGIDNDQNGYVDDVAGWDFGDNDNDPMDENGHGTAVGSILADTAPGVIIMPLKINSRSNGIFNTEELVAAVRYAVDNGAGVINLSLTVETRMDSLASEIRTAVGSGILVVAAAGNFREAVAFPASMEETLSVGAVDYPERDAEEVYPAEALIDLVTPGKDVEFTGLGGGMETGSGSSFSAPMAAGSAAVLMAMNPFLRVETVRNLLLSGTIDLGEPGKDPVYGSGALNGRALYDVGAPRIIFRGGTFSEIAEGEKVSVDFYLPPTDTPSSVYVAIERENEIWCLDSMGNWMDVSKVPAEPLAGFPMRSGSVSGTLFGEPGLFPPFEPLLPGTGQYRWGVAVVDESGFLLGPITWWRMSIFRPRGPGFPD